MTGRYHVFNAFKESFDLDDETNTSSSSIRTTRLGLRSAT